MQEPPLLLTGERGPGAQEIVIGELAGKGALGAKLGKRLSSLIERALARWVVAAWLAYPAAWLA